MQNNCIYDSGNSWHFMIRCFRSPFVILLYLKVKSSKNFFQILYQLWNNIEKIPEFLQSSLCKNCIFSRSAYFAYFVIVICVSLTTILMVMKLFKLPVTSNYFARFCDLMIWLHFCSFTDSFCHSLNLQNKRHKLNVH